MYDHIKRKSIKTTAKYIVVGAGGLGYIVSVINPYSLSDLVNQEVQIYSHQVIRKDAQLLFGFCTKDEKVVFLNLISAPGIGPTTAPAVIAVDDNEGLANAVNTNGIKYLMEFPKIGKKTAQQMVLDLTGEFVGVLVENDKVSQTKTVTNEQLEGATEALLTFGYKAVELEKIRKLFEETSETTE